MTCSYQFFDIDGKPSSVYKKVSSKKGHSAGVKAYIDSILTSNVDFSKTIIPSKVDIDDLIKSKPDIKVDANGNIVNGKLRGITSLVASLKEVENVNTGMFQTQAKLDTEVIVAKSARNKILAMMADINKNIVTDREQLEKLTDERIAAEPEEFAKVVEKVRAELEAAPQWGTAIHAVMQKAFEKFNELYPNGPLDKKYAINDLFLQLRKEDNSKPAAEQIFAGMTQRAIDGIQDTFKETINIIDNVGNSIFKGSKFRIVPELYLSDDELGIHGIADIVLADEEGRIHIIDFKTTSLKKDGTGPAFDRDYGGKFGGPFKRHQKATNSGNSAHIQMSYYSAILAKKGFTPTGTTTVLVGIDTFKADRSIPGFFANKRANVMLDNVKVQTDYKGFRPSLHRDIIGDVVSEDDITQGLHNTVNSLISTEANNNFPTVHDDLKAYIERMKNNAKEDPKTGKKWIYRKDASNAVTDKRLFLDAGEETINRALTADYNERMNDDRNLAYNVINYFTTGGSEVSNNIRRSKAWIDRMFKHISNETHILMTAADYDSTLRGAGPDVLVAINKATGAVSLYSVITQSNKNFRFNDITTGHESRTTFFGKYATDRQVKSEGISSESTGSGTIHDAATFKLGLIAMQLQAKKKVTIDEIKAASFNGESGSSITTSYIAKEIDKLRVLLKYAGDKAPKELHNLYKNPKVTKSSNYGGSALDTFKTMLNDATNFKMYGNDFKNLRKSLQQKLKDWEPGSTMPYNAYKELIKFQTSLRRVSTVPEEEMLAADRAVLEVTKLNLLTKQVMTDFVGRKIVGKSTLRTTMTSGDALQERLQVLYNESMTRIRNEFYEHNQKQKKLLLDLANEYNGNLSKAYENLYLDFKREGDFSNYMKLKPVTHHTLIGKPASQAFIKYFNEQVKNNYKRLLSTAEFAKFERGETWTEGMVPLMISHTGLLEKATFDSYDSFKSASQREFDKVARSKKAFESKEEQDRQMEYQYEYKLDKWFTAQVGNSGPQNSQARLHLLGVDEEGKPIKVKHTPETNLALILNNFLVTTSESEHFAPIFSAIGSMSTVLKDIHDSNPDLKQENTLKVLNDWYKMVIYSEYGDETGKVVEIADKVRSLTSVTYFAARISSMATELMTGGVQSTSAAVANSISNVLKKGSGRFDLGDWAWATKAWSSNFDVDLSSKLHKIVYDNGMDRADPAQLKSKDMASLSKLAMFKSNPMYYVNRVFFNSSITHTFLAEMKNKGIIDAYVNKGTSKEPKWLYDETLDKRFYVYDPNGNYGSKMKNKPPTTPVEKQAYEFWKAVRSEMDSEGTLREDGSMTVPLTSKERTDIKFYATKIYGSFNKDTIVNEQTSFVARLMFVYKHWFIQKAANYWTPTDMSEARGEWIWVADEEMENGGYWDFTGLPAEGILHSIGRLISQAQEQGFSASVKGMDQIQRENLGKLLADLLLLGIITALVGPLFEKNNPLMKTSIGQDLGKAFKNSTSDLFIVGTALNMGDSISPTLSSIATTLKNLGNGAAAMATGDEKRAVNLLGKVPKMSGVYSSVYTIMDAAFPPETVIKNNTTENTK